jgi:uncharacterized protein DUF3309
MLSECPTLACALLPRPFERSEGGRMSLVLLIVVLLVVLGGLPQVSGHNYGYGPSGVGGIVLLVLLILLLTGRM